MVFADVIIAFVIEGGSARRQHVLSLQNFGYLQ